jgi:hypothetical protein
MDCKGRLATLALAALVGGGLLLGGSLTAVAGQPAPLPVQIPIRDASEPPTPGIGAKPFTPAPAHRKVRRTRPARHRRRPAAPKPAQAPKAPTTTTGPKLEQRPEAATESIMSLDTLPAPTGAKAGPAPASGPKPAPASAPPPGPAAAEFPPVPDTGSKPAPGAPKP